MKALPPGMLGIVDRDIAVANYYKKRRMHHGFSDLTVAQIEARIAEQFRLFDFETEYTTRLRAELARRKMEHGG